jgi:tetratricopeptide (TPR) repeat protein
MPRSAVALETHFNLGLAQTRAGDAAAAREAFYWVADRSPGHELAPLSYLKIGRLFLEENDPTAALRALRRAQSAVPGTPTHAAAALLLAAAHLMTNNPRAAHAALAEDEEALNRPPFRQAAAVLDGLARYRAVSDPKKAMREASELLTALMSYREDSVLGPVGLVLAGQGFRDIGMNEEMTAVYQKALPTMHGGLALEMSADLADHYFTLGQYQAARPLFESVAKQPGKRVASAELRLAEIDLKEHHPDECLKRCRMLLKEGQTAELDTTLKLMGQAHAERGEHALAARCFAGELPKP